MTTAPTGPQQGHEGVSPPGVRPRDDERRTRKPLAFWDRIKFLLLLALIWVILLWSALINDPGIPFSDGVRIEVRAAAWVIVLAGLEALRQIHFLISEHWAGYHQFWTQKFFGGTERLTRRRLSPWTRFRLWRVLSWLFWIAVIAV
ncbi:MAG: ATPase, partial [Actinobacteria bacterium]|nr:ATPase [Actinomycetota bacterium]